MPLDSVYDSAGFVAEFYDHVAIYANRPDADYYVAEARATRGPALELGCGTGRILIPTARAGAEITGLDLSTSMLARCREKLAGEPAEVCDRVKLVRASMTRFDLGREFALITIPFRGFQHLLEVEDQLACLGAIRKHLAPGGRMVVDFFQVNPAAMHDPAWSEEKEDTPETALPDGRKIRRTTRIAAFHRARQVNDIEFIWYVTHPDGRAERLVWQTPLRYFFRYEVEHLLARAGLHLVELRGDFAGAVFSDDSPDMIFVAEKAEQS
jgi:SAM-dependent methyltransferase